MVGETIADRFEIEYEAGRGGMGTVYRARDVRDGQAVALKLLRLDDDEDAQRFAREASALAQLRHPGIVRYVDHGTVGEGVRQRHYLAMEWLDGETLGDRLDRKSVTLEQTLHLAQQVAEALSAIHRLGVVHRDIKPDNLFLIDGKFDQVKIIDFGIARPHAADPLTRPGIVLGSLHYLAPEQARGARNIDGRSDIFALGCVLFKCLTGRTLFEGHNIVAVLAKIVFEEPPPIHEMGADVPPEVELLLARMLAKTPAERFSDAGTLGRELAQVSELLTTAGPLALGRALTPASLEALTGREQRIVSVILVGNTGLGPADATVVDLTQFANREGARGSNLGEIVGAHRGRLEVLADGSMVILLTGADVPTDQAVRTARLALAVRAVLADSRIVLVTGRAEMFQRLPIGEVIERGVKVLADAQRGCIRLDEATAGLLDMRFDVGGDRHGLVLRGEREVRQVARTVCGRATSCVGREREIAQLEAFLDECRRESVARAVLIVGAVGIGKSRLRQEFFRRIQLRSRPPESLVAWGESVSAGSPFALAIAAIRRAAGLIQGEPPGVQQKKLHARLARVLAGPELHRTWEFFSELVGASVGGEASEALRAARQDARLMGDVLRGAWLDWLEAELAAGPLILMLEDLHWGDLPSVRLFDAALRHLRDRPLLVVALARPEVREAFPALWQEREVHEIRLGGLTRNAATTLVREVLGADAAARLVTHVLDRADGNPFFLEELVRAVASGRSEGVPETVLGMVQARLDGLGSEAKRVLRAASVFGEVFWWGGVCALLGGEHSRAAVREWLRELSEQEVIFEKGVQRFPGEREYVFRHGLLRDAAYAMLTDDDRALGHRLAGQWLDKTGERDMITLAEHFDRGRDPARALSCYHRGAAQALEGNDLEAAIARAERAIGCGASGETVAALRLLQAQAHVWRGEYAQAEGRALEASQAVTAGTRLWFNAIEEAIAAVGQQGQYERAEQLVGIAETGQPDAEARAAQLSCLSRAAGYLMDGGRHSSAQALLARGEALSSDVPRLDPAVRARMRFAEVKQAVHAGQIGVFLLCAEETLRLLDEVGDARNACAARVDLATAYAELGAFERAEELLRVALANAVRMELSPIQALALLNLGPIAATLGELVDARSMLRQAAELFERQRDRRLQGGAHLYLSTVAMLAGDAIEAERQARVAGNALESVPPLRASSAAALARALLSQGRIEEASVAADEAMRLLHELGGIEEYEALARLVHVDVLAARGQAAEAGHALQAACDRLLTRAARIKDLSLRESFMNRVADNARTLRLGREWGIVP
jgi:tetratricopeptide (TPR) repeat protein